MRTEKEVQDILQNARRNGAYGTLLFGVDSRSDYDQCGCLIPTSPFVRRMCDAIDNHFGACLAIGGVVGMIIGGVLITLGWV